MQVLKQTEKYEERRYYKGKPIRERDWMLHPLVKRGLFVSDIGPSITSRISCSQMGVHHRGFDPVLDSHDDRLQG